MTNQDPEIGLIAASAALSEVALAKFAAIPASIGPFGASLLSWDVVGPDQGFFLDLDGHRVPLRSEMIVTPTDTQTFVLRARTPRRSQVLGRVTVLVNLTRCQSSQLPDIGRIIERSLNSVIDDDPLLYFRTVSSPGQLPKRAKPIVEIKPNRIAFTLLLQRKTDDAPDPLVDIEASFELGVTNGLLVAHDEDISVDVRVPAYLWLVPGAFTALPIALADGKQRARNGARQIIRLILATLNFYVFAAERRLQSVRIELVEHGIANLELIHCPVEPLKALISAELAPT